ncbi:MAG: ABC transporter substrate-binding protein/permease [Aerococcus sp.]|nr:ABC transporter substrate-binding protein/permease [Aerococcus sp.]
MNKLVKWLCSLLVLLTLVIPYKNVSASETMPKIAVDQEALNQDLETPGVLRVGMEANYNPFNWSQPDDSNGAEPIANSKGEYANGYDVHVARQLADALGLKLEIMKIEWDGLPPALQSGKIDAIIAGMSPTPDRLKQIDFSNYYYHSDIILVVKKDGPYTKATSLNDFRHARVTGQLNTLHYDLINQIPEVDKRTAMDTFSSMVEAVKTDKIDAYVSERAGGEAAIAANPTLTSVQFQPGQGFDLKDTNPSTAVGVRKGSPLLKAVNTYLETFDQKAQDQLMSDMIALNQRDQKQGFWGQVISIWNQYYKQFLRGAGNTMAIALVSTFLGFVIGLIIAIYRSLPIKREHNPLGYGIFKLFDVLLTAYIEVFRGTPMMVQSMLIFYGTKQFFNIDMPAFTAAFFIVSLNTGAYLAEIIRGGISGVDDGQYEGAKAIGMSHFQTMRYVIIPQVIKSTLPAIGNELVMNIKDTSVLNVIAVTELFFASKSAAGSTYLTFQTYFITCVIYFILTFATTRILNVLEKRLQGSDNYQVASNQSSTEGA